MYKCDEDTTTTTTTTKPVKEITSPNYPEKYPSNPTKNPITKHMEVSDGHKIKITFTDFQLEGKYGEPQCRYDYVTIEDADGTMLLDKTCGSNMPREPIFSNTNKALLTFHSDGYVQLKGFRLEWEEIPDCKDKHEGNVLLERQSQIICNCRLCSMEISLLSFKQVMK